MKLFYLYQKSSKPLRELKSFGEIKVFLYLRGWRRVSPSSQKFPQCRLTPYLEKSHPVDAFYQMFIHPCPPKVNLQPRYNTGI